MTRPLDLVSLKAHVYRAPSKTPVKTSFGTMLDRPMVLVEAEDRDGVTGWGEVWCNFPNVGAEYRARIVEGVLAPFATTRPFEAPDALFEHLTKATEVLAIQSGEAGPFAQAIAGIDIAVWDLTARKQSIPLWRLMGGSSPSIRVYASGLNPTSPELPARARYDAGPRAFKLKIGFGPERDISNLGALRRDLGPKVDLMADANQAWTLEDALEIVPRLEPFSLIWLEEPLRADQPWSERNHLRSRTRQPLAAGENILGLAAFEAALAARTLSFLQPDLAKWGGCSCCRLVARKIAEAGCIYCPHYLGGGIGLLASAHLLAATGGAGRLEIDANENPLRSDLCGPLERIHEGYASLSEEPGLGVGEKELKAVERFRVRH